MRATSPGDYAVTGTVDVPTLALIADIALALCLFAPSCASQVAGATGGVSPVGHPEPLRTIVDIALSRFDEIWAAAGHPHYVFPTTYDELLRITAGEAAEVGA